MSAAGLGRPHAPRCVWQCPRSRWRIDPAYGDRTPSIEFECAGHCSFGLFLVENGRNQVGWHRLEMGGFHRITGAALRKRTDGSRVTEQLGKRNFGMNDRQTAARFDVVDAPTTPAQVAANVALIFFRR